MFHTFYIGLNICNYKFIKCSSNMHQVLSNMHQILSNMHQILFNKLIVYLLLSLKKLIHVIHNIHTQCALQIHT